MTPSPKPSSGVLYIYYRSPNQAEKFRPELQAFLQHVENATTVRGRLLYRRSSDGETLTWLEVYEAIPEDFKTTLRELWSGFEVDKSPYGDRREEEFLEVQAP